MHRYFAEVDKKFIYRNLISNEKIFLFFLITKLTGFCLVFFIEAVNWKV